MHLAPHGINLKSPLLLLSSSQPLVEVKRKFHSKLVSPKIRPMPTPSRACLREDLDSKSRKRTTKLLSTTLSMLIKRADTASLIYLCGFSARPILRCPGLKTIKSSLDLPTISCRSYTYSLIH